MPAGDRTGPEGHGEMAGRGLGPCAGYDYPGYAAGADPLPRGRGGRGRGWRFRNVYRATGLRRWQRPYGPPPADRERPESLEDYARRLREEAEAVEKEIERLKTDDGEE